MNIIRIIPHACEEKDLPSGASKMWGSPDLPHSFNFPTYKDEEGDDVHYVFMCQINCSDLAPFDKENVLPHKGMLYIFARLDYALGDFLAEPMPSGFWDREDVKVLFWPHDKTETLEENVLIDDDGIEVAPRPYRLEFSCVEEDAGAPYDGYKMLGTPAYLAEEIDMSRYRLLFQLDSCEENDRTELNLMDCGMLYFLIPYEDLGCTFRNVTAYLASS